MLVVIGRPAVRSGIKQGLSEDPGIEIVGEAVDCQEWPATAAELRPDVALVGAPVLAQVPAPPPDADTRTPVLAAMPEYRDAYLSVAVDAGALGYVLEDIDPTEIAAALHRVAAGQAQWSRDDRVRARHWQETVGQRWRNLTERERAVLRLLARGMDTRAIANTLTLAPKTVENYIGRILDKLALESRAQAVVWYLEELPPSIRGDERG
ncbi:MAG: response regulator transcription factor [Anaerolineae bacterium]|nr:response regulator transcription factor [Anaerolineae bacterium]